MNRHFQSYAALPCEPLGTPIRKQEEKKSPETPWKPMPGHPDYRERINAQGVREVSHKDNVPPPVVGLTQAESEARGDVTTLAPSAQTEWQSGPPPSVGWYDSYCRVTDFEVTPLFMASYWDGACWTHNTSAKNSCQGVVTDRGWCKVWRGPRLTGEAWPEPQQ